MLVPAAVVIAAIVALGFAVWLWRSDGPHRIGSPEEAAAAAEAALTGFRARDVVLGTDGAAALAVGTDGRLAAIKRRGAHPAVREIRWTAVRPTPNGALIETGERRFGSVLLAGVNALHLRRIAG